MSSACIVSLTWLTVPAGNGNEDSVHAGKKQTAKKRGGSAKTVSEQFREGYDAPEGYTGSPKGLTVITGEVFDVRDIVVVEATVHRYRVDAHGKAVYGVRAWDQYKVTLELVRIYRLQEGVDVEEAVPQVDDE